MLFFFNHTATTEIYTLSLHDALPIFRARDLLRRRAAHDVLVGTPVLVDRHLDEATRLAVVDPHDHVLRSEEHTSELQSRRDLVCRLLLEKKKKHYQDSLVTYYQFSYN